LTPAWLLALLLAVGPSAQPTIETYTFATPAQEQRYKDLIDELRCLVCQNQNLADSDAELAQDLRRKTYEMIKAGKGDGEILDYMVQRYGDFVLYRPPLKGTTLALWVGPFLILAIGVGVLMRVISRRRAETNETDDAAALSRVERLLAADKDRKA
jgi:cytochrome c-type biogenesis protein CcmH